MRGHIRALLACCALPDDMPEARTQRPAARGMTHSLQMAAHAYAPTRLLTARPTADSAATAAAAVR